MLVLFHDGGFAPERELIHRCNWQLPFLTHSHLFISGNITVHPRFGYIFGILVSLA